MSDMGICSVSYIYSRLRLTDVDWREVNEHKKMHDGASSIYNCVLVLQRLQKFSLNLTIFASSVILILGR